MAFRGISWRVDVFVRRAITGSTEFSIRTKRGGFLRKLSPTPTTSAATIHSFLRRSTTERCRWIRSFNLTMKTCRMQSGNRLRIPSHDRSGRSLPARQCCPNRPESFTGLRKDAGCLIIRPACWLPIWDIIRVAGFIGLRRTLAGQRLIFQHPLDGYAQAVSMTAYNAITETEAMASERLLASLQMSPGRSQARIRDLGSIRK